MNFLSENKSAATLEEKKEVYSKWTKKNMIK
jgi:hypothetical protein